MSASVENESEILLGNKQLLVIFAVVALLLAVAFTGGYMLGKSSAEKKAAVSAETPANTTSESSSALVTRNVTPDDQPAPKSEASGSISSAKGSDLPERKAPTAISPTQSRPETNPGVQKEPVLGRRKESRREEDAPQSGQTYVQVAALTRPQAEATADVLRKQRFPARIAPKPGSATIFRVLVGPTKDAGDITATRDALRKIGFRDVIVQRY